MQQKYQKRVYFKFYNFNHIFLDITFQRITLELFKSVFLYLNIYEVNIDSKIIENISLISALLNECQCAFFIIDITNTHSLKRIKDLLNIIKLNNYPYLHVILLENKIDLENSRKISKNDINQYLKLNPFIKYIKISLKNDDNFGLLNTINDIIYYNNKNIISSNIVLETIDTNIISNNINDKISFLLLGDTLVGKSNFIRIYFNNIFIDGLLPTIGIQKEITKVKIGKDIIKIIITDTPRNNLYILFKSYYQNSKYFFILFDVTNKNSFNRISFYMETIESNFKNYQKQNIYLIANKIDSFNRIISKEEAETYAASIGIKYCEISCKYNINIHEIVNTIILEDYIKNNNIDNYSELFVSPQRNKYAVSKNKLIKYLNN